MRARPILLGLGLVAALVLNAMDPPAEADGPALPIPRVRGIEGVEAKVKSPGDIAPPVAVPGSLRSGSTVSAFSIPTLRAREALFGPHRQRTALSPFEARSWHPPPPPRQAEAVARPTAPPLPFRFVGRQWTDGRQEVFISSGDKVLVARAGEQLDGGFRVDSVESGRILFTYLPLETSFQLQFGVPE